MFSIAHIIVQIVRWHAVKNTPVAAALEALV